MEECRGRLLCSLLCQMISWSRQTCITLINAFSQFHLNWAGHKFFIVQHTWQGWPTGHPQTWQNWRLVDEHDAPLQWVDKSRGRLEGAGNSSGARMSYEVVRHSDLSDQGFHLLRDQLKGELEILKFNLWALPLRLQMSGDKLSTAKFPAQK